ncbi:MAG: putative zinc-binding metallopeptidase [Ginsengibacter sp.]
MKFIKPVFFILITIAIASCKKDAFNASDADNINGLGGDTWVKGPIDNWIYDSLTVPYNMSVKYKWDQFEDISDITKVLVPPKEENVVPILSAVRKVWINPYIAEAGDVFFKRLSPKFIYMIGSPAFEENGGIKLGQAEGGRKIILLAINLTKVKGMYGYNQSDTFWLKEMFHTIHHEFAHILHQTVAYPEAFKNLNPNLYTTEWINYTQQEALQDGFITAYSMNVVDDDFVEMVSIMLIEGKAGFESLIASIQDITSPRGTTKAQAVARLRAKESIVVNYFKQVWNIDFYSLQAKVRSQIESLIY